MNEYEYQNDAYEHLQKWRVGALFMEAGTGKTKVAHQLIQYSKADICIWFAPLHTLNNAKDEIEKWGKLNMPIVYVGIESISQSKRIYLNVEEQIENAERPFVVVDESLKIKNITSIRTQRILQIGNKAYYRLILNGTPLSKNLLDLYPQMLFLSPKILNMTYNQFKDTFCRYKTIKNNRTGRRIETITGYENIDYLYSLISNYIYECDLSMNIEQNWHDISYILTEEEKQEYFEIKDYFLNLETLDSWNNNIFMAMTQKMQHSYCTAPSKIRALERLFETTIDESKTIIFCKFIDSRELCETTFRKAKVLSYQKEAFGLNLQEYNQMVFFDKTFDWALRAQASRRIFRVGQKNDCQYYDMTGNVGLENIIDRNIEKKTSMSEYFKSKTKKQIQKEL